MLLFILDAIDSFSSQDFEGGHFKKIEFPFRALKSPAGCVPQICG
jgi:hypothetical protein